MMVLGKHAIEVGVDIGTHTVTLAHKLAGMGNGCWQWSPNPFVSIHYVPILLSTDCSTFRWKTLPAATRLAGSH